MADPTITYFPVGNGDTTLIKLGDGTTIIIDLNITETAGDESDKTRYDVHAHLLKEVRRDQEGWPHTDAFILSHPDQDHIRSFDKTFFVGDPSKYSEADKKKGRIIIDELWFAPRIFSPHEKDLCDDARALRKEAHRRIELYRKGGEERTKPGNRIRVIGYSDNPDLQGLEAILTVPGSSVNLINGSKKGDFEFFVHAPFKKDTDAQWEERNRTSIVLQARFTVDKAAEAALAFFGGDAGSAIWEEIFDKSDEKYLQWDLFLAPHHCSWTFFSELPSEENKPSRKILQLLERRRKGAFVISSSKPIKDDDDNPPHYQAAELYRERVGRNKFLCTMEHPTDKKPEPIYFSMSKNGPVKDEYSKGSQILSSAALKATVSTPQTYGQ